MIGHSSKAFFGNRHSGCQLFLAQSIRPDKSCFVLVHMIIVSRFVITLLAKNS